MSLQERDRLLACGCRERGFCLWKDSLNQPVLFSAVLCNLSMAGNGNASETKESKLTWSWLVVTLQYSAENPVTVKLGRSALRVLPGPSAWALLRDSSRCLTYASRCLPHPREKPSSGKPSGRPRESQLKIKTTGFSPRPEEKAAESSPATVALTRGLPAKGKPQEISFQPLQQAPPWFVREGRPLNANTDSPRSQVVKARVFCAVLTKPTSASCSLT